ncbi:MAG: hypothetical protein ACK4F9_01960 [Brevinematia bacterium]
MMQVIVLSNNRIFQKYFEKIAPSNFTINSDLNDISSFNSSVVITDSTEIIPVVKNYFSSKKKNILIFVSGVYKLKKENNFSYEFYFLNNIISSLATKEVVPTKVTPLQIGQNAVIEESKIEENIKYISELSIDKIISFANEFSIPRKVRDDIIIASSEIIDNIIEINTLLNKFIVKIKMIFTLDRDTLEITISDCIGLADIYSISNSLENAVILSDSRLSNYMSFRGRGYTLMRKTSDFVMTKILGPKSFRKYKESEPFTETRILYLLKSKKHRDKPSLGVVMEFF